MIAPPKPRRSGLSRLCATPRLTPTDERRLFSELKSVAERLDRADSTASKSRLNREYQRLRNHIAAANVRLAVAAAKPFAAPEMPVEDLVAAGMPPLIRAVELFDPSRGYRFSTYATHALRNHFLRLRKRRIKRTEREAATTPAINEQTIDGEEPVERTLERTEMIGVAHAALLQLPERDRYLLTARFGLKPATTPQTLQQIARTVGLSKERVRVLTHRAVDRLRELVEPTVS